MTIEGESDGEPGESRAGRREQSRLPRLLRNPGQPVDGETPLMETVTRNINLYGPGDIVGIDPSAIVKVEPRDQITNFEPNYLPYIEFYDEDFPWRYTPAAPDTALHRLRPWLALIVFGLMTVILARIAFRGLAKK